MNLERIAALAASGESETLEFKETTGTGREAAVTVCAFLNQGGGQVLFGVTSDGAVVGPARQRVVGRNTLLQIDKRQHRHLLLLSSTHATTSTSAGYRSPAHARGHMISPESFSAACDEFGYVHLDPRGAELLFQVLTEREERASVAVASNAPFSEWGRPSTTPASPPRSSTGSRSMPTSSRPAANPIAYGSPRPRGEVPRQADHDHR